MRPVKKQRPKETEDEKSGGNETSLARVVVLSLVFVGVLVTLLSALAIISNHVNTATMSLITIAGILFAVVFFVMIAAFSGVINQTTITTLLSDVLKKISIIKSSG